MRSGQCAYPSDLDLTGGSEDKKQTGFLRRIFSTLSVFRKEETAYSKAANKSLKLLEEKPEAKGSGDGGGLLGMMSGLLSKIPVIGPMLAGKGLLGAGKGMLRRIPLLGALIGGVAGNALGSGGHRGPHGYYRDSNRGATTAIGAIAGGLIGNQVEGTTGGTPAYQTVRRCTNETVYENRTVGYDVT